MRLVVFSRTTQICLSHKEGVFESFVVAIDMYGKGLLDINYLRHEVSGLFEDHLNLLDGFSIYASDTKIRKEEEEEKSATSIKKHGLKVAVDQGYLLFRKIGKVLGESALRDILVCSHCYCNTPSPLRLGLSPFFFYNKIFAKIHKVYQST
jgi:hypothetical protein